MPNYKEREGNPELEPGGFRLLNNLALDVAGNRKKAITLIRDDVSGNLIEMGTGKKIFVNYKDPINKD